MIAVKEAEPVKGQAECLQVGRARWARLAAQQGRNPAREQLAADARGVAFYKPPKQLPRQHGTLIWARKAGGLVPLANARYQSSSAEAAAARHAGIRPASALNPVLAAGNQLTYRTYAGVNHVGVITAGEPDALAFFQQMLPPRR